jgi:hypothetical protein
MKHGLVYVNLEREYVLWLVGLVPSVVTHAIPH